MVLAVYCPRKSDGARHLVLTLRGLGVEAILARNPEDLTKLINRDRVVVWGEPLHGTLKVPTLNAKAPLGSKVRELKAFLAAKIPHPEFQERPPANLKGWHSRAFHHQAGKDLLGKVPGGDYFTRHVDTVHEFRVHVFQGHGFRVGVKRPDPERKVHPFVRTHRAGWYLSYRLADLDAAGPRGRAIHAAVKAVKAVGYDFGAVDVGITVKGNPVVFEVNSAPGLEGGTIERYARLIAEWARN